MKSFRFFVLLMLLGSAEWYRRLGYEQEWVHRFEPSFPAFVSLARDGSARIFLSEHQGDARPDTLLYLRVADVDAVAAEFGEAVVDQPWLERFT